MKKFTELEMSEITREALFAASKATKDFLEKHGDRDCCGFAWVTLRPATSQYARYLKKAGLGSAAYGGGLQVWNPSKNHTQAISAKEEGAYAFARVLEKHGIKCSAGSRLD
jgi:hypothetical protein